MAPALGLDALEYKQRKAYHNVQLSDNMNLELLAAPALCTGTLAAQVRGSTQRGPRGQHAGSNVRH